MNGGGAAERLLVSAYCAATNDIATEDLDAGLSQVERALCTQVRPVYIEGKTR